MSAKWMSLDSPCPEDRHGGKFRVIDCKTRITLKHFRNAQKLSIYHVMTRDTSHLEEAYVN